MKKSCCEKCGAKIVEYTFTFNKGLARCLALMRNHTTGVEIRTLDMTTSEWTNFQKLRYWGLIDSIIGENHRRGGCWRITNLGTDFLNNQISIPKKVTMYRNTVVKTSFDTIQFKDVSADYEYRADYAEQIGHASV